MDKKIPLLIGIPREDLPGGLRVWCPHCKKWHYHGKQGKEIVHKAAHCIYGPYTKTGYYIKRLSKKEQQQILKAIQEGDL